MADPFKTVLLLGAPGAGKGTQGKLLSNVPGFHHMSTGDMFRNLDLESETGREIKGFMTRGELVPDELTVRLWRENIRARVTLGLFKPAMEILLLDGLPRNTAQADLIAEDCDVLAVAHLMAKDEEAMIERLKGRALKEKRPDDAKEEVVRRRLEVYRAETAPVIGYYPSGRVHEIDALGSPGRVLMNALAALLPLQESHCFNPLKG